jgi:subtilase family serine protease
MHLLLNFDKLQKNLLKKYFLQIKEKLQQQNTQLQQQNTQLQQQNTQLQQQSSQQQDQNSQLQQQNTQLQQQNTQLQQQNTQLQQTTEVLKEQNNNLQDLINNSNLDEYNLDEKNIDFNIKINHFHFIHNEISNLGNINPLLDYKSYSGKELLSVYNIPKILPTNNKRKVKIAVIIAYHYDNLEKDLKTYWQHNFGPNSSPPKINVYMFRGAEKNVGWNLEECLDIQMIATVNPNAEIWVIEAKDNSFTELAKALVYARDKLNVDIISMSWGSGENIQTLDFETKIFNNPSGEDNAKCYCASSGDNNDVCWPSTSQGVLSVGGTSLFPNTSEPNNPNKYLQYTWQRAGCGFSKFEKKPSFQSNVNVNSNKRAIPDISLVANNATGVRIFYNNVWYTVGGTSVSCPLFAGILSLANQERFNLNKKPLTTVGDNSKRNVQNALYKIIYEDTPLRISCLTDVIKGTDGAYAAGVGYDIATGLGTPNVTNLCNILTNNIS